ncbi:MAG: sulfatase-like hydrolase/transferase [Terriglobales bacterium]
MNQKNSTDVLLALSLANLTLIKVWKRLLYSQRIDLPQWTLVDYEAVFLNLLLLTGFFWLLFALGRRSSAVFSNLRYLPFLAIVVPLDLVRRHLDLSVAEAIRLLGKAEFAAIGLVLAGFILYGSFRWSRSLLAALQALTLIMTAFVPVVLVQAGWKSWVLFSQEDRPPRPLALSSAQRPVPPQRILFLLFDGLDQRLTFGNRPLGLQLPELDGLRSKALYSDHAYQPNTNTASSTVILLTGRETDESMITVPGELLVDFRDTPGFVPLSTQPNLLRQARALGYNVAVAGWFLPYCRMFGDALTGCTWRPSDLPMPQPGLLRSMYFQLRSVSPFELRQAHVDIYQDILQAARTAASNPQIDFTFVHWPIPHGPFVFDRQTGEFTVFSLPARSYLDNLVLVDRTIGELRQAMERAGTWDKTAILVTSDHHWRLSDTLDGRKDPRVPFILKMPGQEHARPINRRISHILVHQLVEGILKAELTDARAVEDWLSQHAGPP